MFIPYQNCNIDFSCRALVRCQYHSMPCALDLEAWYGMYGMEDPISQFWSGLYDYMLLFIAILFFHKIYLYMQHIRRIYIVIFIFVPMHYYDYELILLLTLFAIISVVLCVCVCVPNRKRNGRKSLNFLTKS